MIEVEALTKVYRVPIKDPGFLGSIRSLWNRQYNEVRAVNEVHFSIEPGERVGFLGPNGAGKTTTLKMLTGLLHPTSGHCRVAGHTPKRRNAEFLRSITLVMGQKQQLFWDLPPFEAFLFNRAMFDLDHRAFQESLDELVDLLELREFLDRPVRNLSLGQRMRCELAAALLHRPQILFLDEPTIGMDVEVQAVVRRFVTEYNRRHNATIMLTSHDMSDVAMLAKRIILIDQGVVRYDGPLEGLSAKFGAGRRVIVGGPESILAKMGFERIEHSDDSRFMTTVPANKVNQLLTDVLAQVPEADVTVADPPLEEVMRTAFGDMRRDT